MTDVNREAFAAAWTERWTRSEGSRDEFRSAGVQEIAFWAWNAALAQARQSVDAETLRLAGVAVAESTGVVPTQDWQEAALKACRGLLSLRPPEKLAHVSFHPQPQRPEDFAHLSPAVAGQSTPDEIWPGFAEFLRGKGFSAEQIEAEFHSNGLVRPPSKKDAPAPPLKDHEIAAAVNQLRDIAIEFHGAQQLRERIAQVVTPLLRRQSAASEAPLTELELSSVQVAAISTPSPLGSGWKPT